MRTRIKAGVVMCAVVLLVAAVPLIGYGTLRPCGILQQDVQASLTRKALAMPTRTAGQEVQRTLGLAIVAQYVSTLSTYQCVSALKHIHWDGDAFGKRPSVHGEPTWK
jgi:hypothetical protein